MAGADDAAWNIDLVRWPVIVVQPRPNVTDAQLRAALESYSRILASRAGAYVMVMDNRAASALSASQRKIIAEYNSTHEARTRARCRGVAFVMTSSFVRGIMTAVFWLKKPATETRVFEDYDDAMLWAEGRVSLSSLSPRRRDSQAG